MTTLAPTPPAPAPVSPLTTGRIATRWVCGLLAASEAIALLQKAGLTYETACDELARWEQPVTEFIDDTTDWALSRADHE